MTSTLPTSFLCFFFSSRSRHTRCSRDWSSDVCSSDLGQPAHAVGVLGAEGTHAAVGAVGGRAAAPDGAEYARADPAVQIAARDIGASRLESQDRKSTRLNSSHGYNSYAVFCLKK